MQRSNYECNNGTDRTRVNEHSQGSKPLRPDQIKPLASPTSRQQISRLLGEWGTNWAHPETSSSAADQPLNQFVSETDSMHRGTTQQREHRHEVPQISQQFDVGYIGQGSARSVLPTEQNRIQSASQEESSHTFSYPSETPFSLHEEAFFSSNAFYIQKKAVEEALYQKNQEYQQLSTESNDLFNEMQTHQIQTRIWKNNLQNDLQVMYHENSFNWDNPLQQIQQYLALEQNYSQGLQQNYSQTSDLLSQNMIANEILTSQRRSETLQTYLSQGETHEQHRSSIIEIHNQKQTLLTQTQQEIVTLQAYLQEPHSSGYTQLEHDYSAPLQAGESVPGFVSQANILQSALDPATISQDHRTDTNLQSEMQHSTESTSKIADSEAESDTPPSSERRTTVETTCPQGAPTNSESSLSTFANNAFLQASDAMASSSNTHDRRDNPGPPIESTEKLTGKVAYREVKRRMKQEIKQKFQNHYPDIYQRALQSSNGPFFHWHGELQLRTYQIDRHIYVTHDTFKLLANHRINTNQVYKLGIGESYKNVQRVSCEKAINPEEGMKVIYDIHYNFPKPIEYHGNPKEKSGVYFTNNYLDFIH